MAKVIAVCVALTEVTLLIVFGVLELWMAYTVTGCVLLGTLLIGAFLNG